MKVCVKTPWARSRCQHLGVDLGASERREAGGADAGGRRLGGDALSPWLEVAAAFLRHRRHAGRALSNSTARTCGAQSHTASSPTNVQDRPPAQRPLPAVRPRRVEKQADGGRCQRVFCRSHFFQAACAAVEDVDVGLAGDARNDAGSGVLPEGEGMAAVAFRSGGRRPSAASRDSRGRSTRSLSSKKSIEV